MPCESPPSRPPIRMGTDTSGSDMVVKLYTSWFRGVAGHPPPELRYMFVPIWTPPHPAGLTADSDRVPIRNIGVDVMSNTASPPPRGVTNTNWLLFSVIGQMGAASGRIGSIALRATMSLAGVIVNFLLA